MLSQEDRMNKIFEAHQKYVDWWLPIDLAGDSFLAPMGIWMFCVILLTGNDEWWNTWAEGFHKIDVFKLIMMLHNDYEGTMELFKNEELKNECKQKEKENEN